MEAPSSGQTRKSIRVSTVIGDRRSILTNCQPTETQATPTQTNFRATRNFADRLQRQVRILPDGSFAFPLVGRIVAAGKLPSAIETEISQGLKTQYRGEVPQVTVSVKSPSGMTFSIVGRVKSPGNMTPGRYLNVMEAIALSGGPDEFANLDNVTIIRKTATGITLIKLRLSAAFKGSPNITAEMLPQIETGDTVIVP